MIYKIGLIGLGNIARTHIAVISQNKKLDLIGGYDLKKKVDFIIPLFDDLDKLIEQCDLLSIMTPHYTHIPLIRKVISSGKKCICEKPLCINKNEVDNYLLEHSNDIFVIFQNRYNKAIKYASQQISNGKLGEIKYIQGNMFWYRDNTYYKSTDWRGIPSKEGGMLYNQGIHLFDTILYLLGKTSEDCKIIYVDKKKENSIINTEDFFKIILDVSGIFVDLTFSTRFMAEDYENSLLFCGRTGSLKIGGSHLDKIIYPSIQIQSEKENLDDIHKHIYGNSHIDNYDEIIKALDRKKNFSVNLTEALERTILLERIYCSKKY